MALRKSSDRRGTLVFIFGIAGTAFWFANASTAFGQTVTEIPTSFKATEATPPGATVKPGQPVTAEVGNNPVPASPSSSSDTEPKPVDPPSSNGSPEPRTSRQLDDVGSAAPNTSTSATTTVARDALLLPDLQLAPLPSPKDVPIPADHAEMVRDAGPKLAPCVEQPASKPATLTFGALLDVGVPDGAMGGVIVRPWSWMHVHGAVGTNAISMGVRGGVLLRLPTWFSPSIGVEGGRYFEGDASPLLGKLAHTQYQDSAMVRRIGYRFANVHLGIELGNRRSTFYLHGGMSYIATELHDAQGTLLESGVGSDGTTSVAIATDPRISAWIPSLKLGFLVYFV